MQTELHLGPVTASTDSPWVTAEQVTPAEPGEPTPALLHNTQNWKEEHLFSHVHEQ